MLIIDTNLLPAVIKYDSAGRLRPGYTPQPASPRASGWHFVSNKIKCSLRQLCPRKTDELIFEGLRKANVTE